MKALVGLNSSGRTLIIAGDDNDRYTKYLKEMAKRADIAIQSVEITDEELIRLMTDNSNIDSILTD